MDKDDKQSTGGFVEQSVLLPRRLWDRVEAICERSDKEPSEIIADALRLLMAGGVPAAPASVGGTRPATEADELAPEPVHTHDLDGLLDDIRNETVDSERLHDQLGMIMRVVEEKDQFINEHSGAVSELARELAQSIGLDEDEVRLIALAALVHDLGKSQIPDSILGKQGRLTPEEWQLVKRYPEFGAEMLGRFTELEEVVPVVRHHQERWDGSGYPDGLKQEDIPVGAQIVGICDVYHVLTSERAYRPALSAEIARRTVEGGSGRLWNPDLSEVFIKKVVGDSNAPSE